MKSILLVFLGLVLLFPSERAYANAEDVSAAAKHRELNIPRKDWGYTYYFTTSGFPEDKRECLEVALKFTLPHLTLSKAIDYQVPTHIPGTNLWMIDTRNFGWEKALPFVLKSYPYTTHGYPPLVIKAEWFIPYATDCAESQTYYILLFGERYDTRQEFIKKFNISLDPQYSFGLIEDNSGVKVVPQGRWIQQLGTLSGYTWFTRDSALVNEQTDPLEHPGGDFKHEAEEWIIGVYKVSLKTGLRGTLQCYFLSDNKGKVQDVAPTKIVTDKIGIRYHSTEIRNGISCMACHVRGINNPTTNALRRLVKNGTEFYAKKKNYLKIEEFHLTDTSKEIARNQEDFQGIVELCTGVEAEEAVACFIQAIRLYDAPVDRMQAARDLGCTEREMILALAFNSNYGGDSARIAELVTDGTPVPRTVWEGRFYESYQALKNWRK